MGQSIDWVPLSKAQQLAAENNKKVMIYAEAKWCGYCKKMERKVFPKESVQDSVEKYFYPVRIDIDSDIKVTFNGEDYTEQGLARKFRTTSTPTLIFVDKKGKIIGGQPGYLPPEIFDKLVAYVGDDKFGTISFEAYLQKHGVEL